MTTRSAASPVRTSATGAALGHRGLLQQGRLFRASDAGQYGRHGDEAGDECFAKLETVLHEEVLKYDGNLFFTGWVT